MNEDSPNTVGFPRPFFSESFTGIGFNEAVGIVGILYEYRIVFSDRLHRLFPEQNVNTDLEPLEPQAASRLVGDIFGMDCDRLF